MNRKLLSLIAPVALMLLACSETTAPVADGLMGSKSLDGVTSSIFDIPSSMSASNPSVGLTSQTATLAKAVAAGPSAEEVIGLEAYKAVPLYINIAETVKDSVKAMMERLSASDLPDSYNGMWGEYQVKLWSKDSLGGSDEGKAFWLTMKKDGNVVLHLQYLRNARSQYKGACYFKSEKQDSVAFLLRFNNYNETLLGKRMTLWVTIPESHLENAGDPSILRVRAVQTPSGKIAVSGVSYHPTFKGDNFWKEGPKVYGFQAVSNPEKNQSVLRVAFADADEVGADFYTAHSLDKAVADRAATILRDSMQSNAAMASLIFYSMDSNKVLANLDTLETYAALTYQYTHNISDFDATQLETYLDINAQGIKSGTDLGTKVLYFHVKVKQPIFFSENATLVGYNDQVAPGFSVTAETLATEVVTPESTETLTTPITDITAEESVDNL
jgi:hypothetical protein